MAILRKIFINIFLLSGLLFAQQPGIAFIGSYGSTVTDTSTNIYVNGDTGSDSNSGLTSSLPKLTYAAAEALVNATTDTIFVTGTFDNPFVITKSCGLVLTAVFYSENLTNYTYVAGSEGGSVTDTYYPEESYDDVWRWGTGSGFYPTYDYGVLGNQSSASMQMAFRFRNITERVNVDSAKVRFHPRTTETDDNVNITISGEQSANPDTISTRYSFDYRKTILTSNSYSYTLRDWTKDVPDTMTVTNIVTELFSDYTYTGTQSLVLFFLNNASTAGAIRDLKTFENGDSIPELLVYSSGAAQNAYYWKIETDSVINVYFGSEVGNAEKADKSLLAVSKDWCYNNDTLYIYGETLPPSGSADYYVTPWGGGDTLSTISEVNALSLVAGDTVAFLPPYEYAGKLIPQNNAVYTSFGANGRYILKNTSQTDEDYVVNANNVSNATIENAEIIGKNWVTADGSYSLTFDNIYCHHEENTNYLTPHDGRGMFRAVNTDNLRLTIKNSIFESWHPLASDPCGSGQDTMCVSDMFLFWDGGGGSNYIDITDNLFFNVSHSLLAFGNGSHHVRIRGNWGYNQFHHFLFLFTNGAIEHDFVVDYNFAQRSGNGQRGEDNPVQYNGEMGAFGMDSYNSIFRYNVIKKAGVPRRKWNNPAAIHMSSNSHDNRIYNNVFDSPYETFLLRLAMEDGDTQLANNYFFNNSFTRGGDTSWVRYYGTNADSAQIILWDYSSTYNPSGNVLEYNYFGSDGNNLYNYSTGQLKTTNTTDWTGFTFQNNIDSYYSRQVYANPDDSIPNYKYWIPQTSRGYLYDSVLAIYEGLAPLVDAGRPHTYINGAVSNDTILVDDARVFFDGWNWLEGDSLLIDTFRVQVIGINYSTNYIALSGNVDVADNTPVYLINPYTHEAYKDTEINVGLE